MRASAVSRAFDSAAPTYDADFTTSVIGRHQRRAFWKYAGPLFRSGDRVLDLGCGTGEDALLLARRGVWVHGIDASPAMVAAAELRLSLEYPEADAQFETLPIERLGELADSRFENAYDGAISNFGPLNCVSDLSEVAAALATLVRPGGHLALNLMGRFCLWETAFYPLTAQIHKAIRRFSSGWAQANIADASFKVYYPAVSDIAQVFAPSFEIIKVAGIGILVPPTYLEPFARRHQRLIQFLGRVDDAIGPWPIARAIADHRFIALRRREPSNECLG